MMVKIEENGAVLENRLESVVAPLRVRYLSRSICLVCDHLETLGTCGSFRFLQMFATLGGIFPSN